MLLLLSEGGRGSARGDAELGRSTEGPAGCRDRVDCSSISTRPAYVPALLSDEGRCCCCCYQKVDAGRLEETQNSVDQLRAQLAAMTVDCSSISTRPAYVPALLSDEGRCRCCYQKVDAGRLEETQNSVDQLRAQLAAMTASTASLVDNTHQQSQVIQVDS